MKSLSLLVTGIVTILFISTGCQKENGSNATEETAVPSVNRNIQAPGTCNNNAYQITLESKIQVGSNWEWIWSVKNPNPGNGNNGTVQDLSHWGMQLGTCVNNSNIISAAYSSNGVNWTSFTPAIQVDPSQECMTSPVLKFDFGTSGGNKSYYKIVVNSNYATGSAPGYYKSGRRTGCCTFNFSGISCGSNPA